MTTNTGAAAVERVWAEALSDPRGALELRLPPTDLQTLLLSVARTRATAVSPARVSRRWREDAFVRPADHDPRLTIRLEAELWRRLPAEFVGLDLSPVAPFGTCAAVAGVDQNRILTTMRGSEVVSDPTTVLAVEAADRRRSGEPGTAHLAACHRVLRTQRFSAPLRQHFRLFALVSSARDVGSGRTEAALLLRHLRYYGTALGQLFPDQTIRLRLSAFGRSAAAERLADTVVPALESLPPNVEVVDDPHRRHAREFYRHVAIRIDLVHATGVVEVGDGGFTDWTARLVPNAKERCLTSCISIERLASLMPPAAAARPDPG